MLHVDPSAPLAQMSYDDLLRSGLITGMELEELLQLCNNLAVRREAEHVRDRWAKIEAPFLWALMCAATQAPETKPSWALLQPCDCCVFFNAYGDTACSKTRNHTHVESNHKYILCGKPGHGVMGSDLRVPPPDGSCDVWRTIVKQFAELCVQLAARGVSQDEVLRLFRLSEEAFGELHMDEKRPDGVILSVKKEYNLEVSHIEKVNILKALHHPRIVAYHGSGVNANGQLEVYMEYCSEGSLEKVCATFKNRRLPIRLIRSYTKQILEGLEYLHSNRVIHRDIKPDNVLVTSSGEVKINHFGDLRTSARVLSRHCYFVAPEMVDYLISDTNCYTTAVDIWSLGCLIIALMGAHPWPQKSSNPLVILNTIVQSTGAPTGIPVDTPPQVREFLGACFERDPSRRGTAAQLLEHRWIVADEQQLEDYQN